MFRRNVCASALVSLCLMGLPEERANAALFQPVQGWVLDYADTQCIAYRDYDNVKKPITLAFRPAPNGETYEILVARKTTAPEFAEELEGSIDFGNGPIKAWLLHYRANKTNLDVYQYRISATQMAQARSARSVTLQTKGSGNFAFSLQSVPQLLSGLDACTADLKQYWNMGGEKDGRIATAAKGDVRGLFSANDYPWQAQSLNQEGNAQYLLLVDEKGGVAGCHVLVPSGVPALDAMGCIALQSRAKFRPALDRNGKAVRSTVVTPQISWRLEG